MKKIKVLFVLFLLFTVGYTAAEYICDKLNMDFLDIYLDEDE